MSVQSAAPTPSDPPNLSVTASLPVRRSPSPLAHSPVPGHDHSASWEPSPHSSSSEHLTPGTASSVGISPQQLVVIQEEEHAAGSLPGSPNLRGSGGKRIGGRKKWLRIPSATSGSSSPTVQFQDAAMSSSVPEQPDELERNKWQKVLNQIRTSRHYPRVPRPGLASFRRTRRVRKSTMERVHHYSDDGYTSDPGVLHVREDGEEEEDTESGDPEQEQRSAQIASIEAKIQKAKKTLQGEEDSYNEALTEYLHGMEESGSDKAQQRVKQRFRSRQPKAKEHMDAIKKKIEKYEAQIQVLKSGGELYATQGHKWRGRFHTSVRTLSGVKNGLKKVHVPKLHVKRRKASEVLEEEAGMDDEDEESGEGEEAMNTEDAILMTTQSQASFANDPDGTHPCECCLQEYQSLAEIVNLHKKQIAEMQDNLHVVRSKLHAEREKSERLEGELNILTDLHQHEVIELRAQLAQMERLTFSKSQDLEDSTENCLLRLDKLEMQVHKSFDSKEISMNIPRGKVSGIITTILSFLLEVLAFFFKMWEHVGTKTGLAIIIGVIAIIIFTFLLNS